tara:strand:- start:1241 stop:1678 length:438 start_codon:yes stop_codon:yes gene_type:complete
MSTEEKSSGASRRGGVDIDNSASPVSQGPEEPLPNCWFEASCALLHESVNCCNNDDGCEKKWYFQVKKKKVVKVSLLARHDVMKNLVLVLFSFFQIFEIFLFNFFKLINFWSLCIFFSNYLPYLRLQAFGPCLYEPEKLLNQQKM